MWVRGLMGALALMWLGYGGWCFLHPEYLREAAGIAALNATGSVDLRATYGGLQAAIGALLLGGAIQPALTRGVLLVYGVLCAGLGSARLGGALLEAEWSDYTLFAVCFELGMVALVTVLLTRGVKS